MKLCRACRQIKPLRFFHRRKSHRDGFNSYCIPCACATERARRLRDGAKVRASQRASYTRNRPARLAAAKRWRVANLEKHRQRARDYYQRNREAYIARAAAWGRAHPARRREYTRRRRARLAAVTVERVDYAVILDRDGAWCYLCESAIEAA